MNRFLTISASAVAAMLIALSATTNVEAGGCLRELGCKIACCPKCSHSCETCTLEAEMVDVEKSCFEVECKTICIPRVVFPWQKKKCNTCNSCDGSGCSSCVNNGARTRKIRVLKKKKYTCPECEYSWAPDENTPCCGTGSCCGAKSCCDTDCCDSDCGCGEASCDGGCHEVGCDSGMIFETPEPVGTYGMFYQEAGAESEPMDDTQHKSSFEPVVIQPPVQ